MLDNEKKITMSDIVCPKCKGQNWYEWSTNEIAFDLDGKGYYDFLIHCNNCEKDSRVSFEFEYNITNIQDIAYPTEKGGAE